LVSQDDKGFQLAVFTKISAKFRTTVETKMVILVFSEILMAAGKTMASLAKQKVRKEMFLIFLSQEMSQQN
jgi:hypothetical protein